MSQKVTAQEGPYITLTEAVAGALTGKDDSLLSLDNAGKAVLYDGTAPAFAIMVNKAWPAATEVQARLLGKGGSVRMIQHVALDIGARVQGRGANARVEALAVGGRSLGFKIGPTSGGAAGDVIEVADLVEPAAVASLVTAPAAATSTNGTLTATAPAALTSTDGVAAAAAADLPGLAAEAEKIGDDVRALHAKYTLAIAEAEKASDDAREALAKTAAIHTALVAQGVLKIA